MLRVIIIRNKDEVVHHLKRCFSSFMSAIQTLKAQ